MAASTAPAAPFAGQLVVFTGRLSSLGRREARELVEALGGRTADDVTAATTMLVVGAEGFGPAGTRPEASRKLRRAEAINAQSPGRIRVLSEEEFCRLAGLPSPTDLERRFYALSEIRARYPAVRDDHLRYLEKWGIVRPVVRTNTERYYGFADLAVIRQVAARLERGASVRAILRGLAAERSGQLTLDFRPSAGAAPARVVRLERTPRPPRTGAPAAADEAQSALAMRYFLEGSALDEAADDPARQEAAAAAYRKALVLDPDLVPAIVNLANIHYARDELIEAQALYERAIVLDPEGFEAYFNLGNIHHDLGRFDEAVTCYRRAVALNPAYPEAHFYLAVTLEKLGRSREAKPHWRAYCDLAPEGEWVALAKEFSES
ncbi:MAG TPA: tetratricopeptide repeat protein [Vicinamibacterales bacterium]|nr:tetratricopeptide repeat protein [Vicinamibacterales bacterium]